MTKEYIYCYGPLIGLASKLSANEMRLLFCMAFLSDDKDMRLETTVYNLIQKTGIGLKLIRKSINTLVTIGAIKKVSDTVFYINPEYMWNRGTNSRARARNKYMK